MTLFMVLELRCMKNNSVDWYDEFSVWCGGPQLLYKINFHCEDSVEIDCL